MTLTLRTRLAAIATIVFGVLLAVLSVASYQILSRNLEDDTSARLIQLSDGLHGFLRFDRTAVTLAFDATDNDAAAFVHEASRYYQVYDLATGQLLAQSEGFRPLGLELTPDEVRGYRSAQDTFDITTEYGRLRVASDIGRASTGLEYLLQVGMSLAPMDQTLARYRRLLLWRVGPSMLVAILASWWLSAFALRPLANLATEARRIDIASLERRLPVRGANDELDKVAVAFNDTLARLEHAVGDMRQFSAALAHELRTPLASLRGTIELGLRKPRITGDERTALASQIDDIDRLARLIDRVLTMARAESGQLRLKRVPVDLGALTASLVGQLELVADASGIHLHGECADGLIVNGDEGWLSQLLLNLIGNALKYTPRDGRVTVRARREHDRVRIDVQDTGIGLSREDADRVFDRFFRADPARSSATDGAGLGLSLVQWIATQHHGHVSVSSELGKGSTFSVTLPLVDPAPIA